MRSYPVDRLLLLFDEKSISSRRRIAFSRVLGEPCYSLPKRLNVTTNYRETSDSHRHTKRFMRTRTQSHRNGSSLNSSVLRRPIIVNHLHPPSALIYAHIAATSATPESAATTGRGSARDFGSQSSVCVCEAGER